MYSRLPLGRSARAVGHGGDVEWLDDEVLRCLRAISAGDVNVEVRRVVGEFDLVAGLGVDAAVQLVEKEMHDA